MSAALTREQKLLAELVVQLGNITEAIRHVGSADSDELTEKINTLQAQLAVASQTKAALQSQLAVLQSDNAALQAELAKAIGTDLTPDSVDEVMSHLGIEHT